METKSMAKRTDRSYPTVYLGTKPHQGIQTPKGLRVIGEILESKRSSPQRSKKLPSRGEKILDTGTPAPVWIH